MSSNRPPVHLIVLGALFLGDVALTPSAQAQSCDGPVSVHSSYPADGAMGVPTNSPLYVYGPELEASTSEVTLQDASGEEVSVDVMATEGGLFIDAFLGFAPATTYEVTVAPGAGGEQWSATFTTGTGPANPVQLAAPDVDVSVIDQDKGSCGVVSAICVNGSVPARMTLEVVVGNEVLSLGGGEPAPAFPAGGGQVAANACIEVRVREPGGSVSESTRLCGSDLGRFELADNAAAPRSCEAYRSEDDDDSSESEAGGCALGASGAVPGAAGSAFGLFALCVARLLRRRR